MDAAAGTVVGTELHKIGATSAWTYGYITGSCVDKWTGAYSDGVELWMVCNTITDIWSEGGDSGSPVFYWPWRDQDYVHFEGILWGGPANDFHETWFSRCYNISKDDFVGYFSYC